MRPGERRYGVVLPHFGAHASRERLLAAARDSEAYGFDSVWVRDHVVYRPYAHEDPDRTHVDPLVTLTAVAAVTERIALGTGVLVPHRHPILSALMLGSLDLVAGPGRVIAGWGIGSSEREFAAVGLGGWPRGAVLDEHVEIVRALWSGRPLDHAGRFYRLTDVDVHPVPGPERTIPLWCGGHTRASVERAARGFDGWLPGRIPLRDLRRLRGWLAEACERTERPLPTVGAINYVVPAATVEEGIAAFDVPALLEDSKVYSTPPCGAFRDFGDLDGAAVAGPPDVIAERVARFHESGVDHFVFDLRHAFARWDECLATLGEQVLPQLRPSVLAG